MKKYLLFFLLCFFIPTFVHAKTVVALGDSITTGYGVEERESYVSLFCSTLKNKTNEDVTCDNLAVNGLTSNGLIDVLQVEETREKIRHSDYILLSIGGNDFLKELTSNLSTYLSLAESYPQVYVIGNRLVNNLSTILDEIVVLNPQVKILIIPLYNPYHIVMKSNVVLSNHFNEIKQRYSEFASHYDQVRIDTKLSNTLERDEYLNVSLEERNVDPHPNRLGHDAIARSLTKEIEEVETMAISQKNNTLSYLFLGLAFILLGVLVKLMKK